MTRLGRLKSVQAAVDESKDEHPAYQLQPGSGNGFNAVDPAIQIWGDTGITPTISYDKHFFVENANPTCWQYFGSSSAYALAVETLVHARTRLGPVTSQEHYPGNEFKLNAHALDNLPPRVLGQMPSRQEVELLVAFYMATTNSLMAYIDVETVAQDIEVYFAYESAHARSFTGQQAHQYFRLSMVCATAAANKARHQPRYHTEAMEYYADAIQCVEEVTSDVSADALVALLLLVNFACFYPRKGDLWKLLDFACRLSVELNYHTEPNNDNNIVFETERAKKERRSIFWGLYCIERTVGQHFGRPSDVTEEIITAEYPETLQTLRPLPQPPSPLHPSTPGHIGRTSGVGDSSEDQFIFTSHYYRLCYLRSEIFRDLYMPATAPDFPRSWYESQLENLLSWKSELQFAIGNEDLLAAASGMGGLTCHVGFEASICFLFQPLLLRALAGTSTIDRAQGPNAHEHPQTQSQNQFQPRPTFQEDRNGSAAIPATDSNPNQPSTDHQATDIVLPRESYTSALCLISFYVDLFRSPEHSPQGMYPISIVSAHYVYTGCLTYLAHVLLSLEPSSFKYLDFTRDLSKPLQVIHENGGDGAIPKAVSPSEVVDPRAVQRIAEDCLFVLGRVAELFPGTVGMYDICRRLAEKIIPAVATASERMTTMMQG